MKKHYNKKIKRHLHSILKYLHTSRVYIYLEKLHIVPKYIIGTILIFYWVISLVLPIFPWAIILILGLLIIFEKKYVKSKILYIINRTRLKCLLVSFIKVYKKIKRLFFNLFQ